MRRELLQLVTDLSGRHRLRSWRCGPCLEICIGHTVDVWLDCLPRTRTEVYGHRNTSSIDWWLVVLRDRRTSFFLSEQGVVDTLYLSSNKFHRRIPHVQVSDEPHVVLCKYQTNGHHLFRPAQSNKIYRFCFVFN